MMRVLLLTVLIAFSSSTAWSAESPARRVCRTEGGQFWILNVGPKEMVMCFFGQAAVGAHALYTFKTRSGHELEAIAAYRQHEPSALRGGVCGAYDAEAVTGKDTAGQTFTICKFSDGSLIEGTTLWLGPEAPENDGLNKALSSFY